jgi:hypothetical protein
MRDLQVNQHDNRQKDAISTGETANTGWDVDSLCCMIFLMRIYNVYGDTTSNSCYLYSVKWMKISLNVETMLFWWIWNLFHEWDRIFNIFTSAKQKWKFYKNPVSRVKWIPYLSSKHWIFCLLHFLYFSNMFVSKLKGFRAVAQHNVIMKNMTSQSDL